MKRELCPAYLKTCRKCAKLSHFVVKCRSKKKDGKDSDTRKLVRAVDNPDSDSEVFYADHISAVDLDDSQLVNLKLESGSYLRFQADTGAQCNVILVELYRKATKDYEPDCVTPLNTHLTACRGSKLTVVGQVHIRVWRDGFKCQLDCKLVDNNAIRPLLGRKACVGIDNDELNKPQTGNASVYAVESTHANKTCASITKETLIEQYPEVFSEGVGKLAGEYHIRIDSSVDPVQHAPHCVPVALRTKVKEALEDLEKNEIVTPVTSPTARISSVVTVPKKNSKLHMCLDPRDLNRVIQHEHYPLLTIEDIATRLHGAKVFTKLDVHNGFWEVALDESSSYLTTFNIPFGR